MNQRKKIILALLSTIILICGLLIDLPGLLINKYMNSEKFQIVNWDGSDLLETPKRIAVKNIFTDPIFKINIKFEYENNRIPYSNLFQTSNYNEGVRLEFSGESAAIIYACNILCEPNGYNVMDITKYLNFSRDNTVILNISQGKYISAKVNSSPEIIIRKPPPKIKFDNILVGTGFDISRGFTGNILHFNLSVISGRQLFLVKIIYYLLLLFLYLGIIFYLKITPTK